MDAPPQPPPGTIVGGDYKISRVLSARGMGRVFVAEQMSTGMLRALKLLRPGSVDDARRFDREVRIGAEAGEPHFAEVLASGIDAKLGAPWLAMELLAGESLETRLLRAGRLSGALALRVLGEVCAALGAAHALGVVHHDLKPSDVWLVQRPGGEPSVRLLDVGVARVTVPAKVRQPDADHAPVFVAPEILAGMEATPRADVWSLGLLAFQVLTARPYLRAAAQPSVDPKALLAEIEDGGLPEASARASELGVADVLPVGFDAWFARCVSRDLAHRFADARKAYDALEPLFEGVEAAPRPAGGASPGRAVRKRTETAREVVIRTPLPPTTMVEAPKDTVADAAPPPAKVPTVPPTVANAAPTAPKAVVFKETARPIKSGTADIRPGEMQRVMALFQGMPARDAGTTLPGATPPTLPSDGLPIEANPLATTLAETARPKVVPVPDVAQAPLSATLESGGGSAAKLLAEERAKAERALEKEAAEKAAVSARSAQLEGAPTSAPKSSPKSKPLEAPAPAPAPPPSSPVVTVVKADPRLMAIGIAIIVLLLVIVVLLLAR